jgi:hypothetical protein
MSICKRHLYVGLLIMRAYLALMLSFGVYFFPLPYHSQYPFIWGQIITTLFYEISLSSPTITLVILITILYQVLCAYGLYKLFEFSLVGILIFCSPLIAFLYLILICIINSHSCFTTVLDQAWNLFN